MARDVELDRLKMQQDYAFQHKQDAWQAQDDAWKRRSAAREAMDSAYADKQAAYEVQDAAWQEYQQIRSSNGPRIDRLNAEQEAAYENMKGAFDDASAAYEARDGESARRHADDGHRYKAESQDAVAERRRLVDEIREARARHEGTKPAFQRAKAEFDRARAEYNRAKSDHEQRQVEFKQTKADFDHAKTAFRERLEAVRDSRQQSHSDKRSLAEQAGVPYQYLDDVWVSTAPDGTVNIYFGGMGGPNGPGHGHYAMDSSGTVTYQREPFDEHGGQNYTDAQQDYDDVIGVEAAGGGEFGLRCRFRGYDAFVESNTNRQGRAKIDIYYGPKGPFAPGHHHAVAYRDDPYTFIYDDLR
jgi:hypothetical protein